MDRSGHCCAPFCSIRDRSSGEGTLSSGGPFPPSRSRLAPTPCSRSGTRKRELFRREPKDKSSNWWISEVETASCLQETHQERWGALPSPFLMAFPEAGSLRRSSLLWAPEPAHARLPRSRRSRANSVCFDMERSRRPYCVRRVQEIQHARGGLPVEKVSGRVLAMSEQAEPNTQGAPGGTVAEYFLGPNSRNVYRVGLMAGFQFWCLSIGLPSECSL
jgi:hypothetical protein